MNTTENSPVRQTPVAPRRQRRSLVRAAGCLGLALLMSAHAALARAPYYWCPTRRVAHLKRCCPRPVLDAGRGAPPVSAKLRVRCCESRRIEAPSTSNTPQDACAAIATQVATPVVWNPIEFIGSAVALDPRAIGPAIRAGPRTPLYILFRVLRN